MDGYFSHADRHDGRWHPLTEKGLIVRAEAARRVTEVGGGG
jgi:hypothetical protein